MSESRPKIYAMPSSSSGPPWSYKDGPLLPVSFLGLLLVSFFFCPPPPLGKHLVTPGVRFGSTFAMVTTVNPMQINALCSVGAMGICNCSNVACVGPTTVSTFRGSCYLSRYLSLSEEEEATDGCYNLTYIYLVGTASLSVSDKISITQGICCRQVQPHSVGLQSDCIPNLPASVGLPTACMISDINKAPLWKLRIQILCYNALLSIRCMHEGNGLLGSAHPEHPFKPHLWLIPAWNLFGVELHFWQHHSPSWARCMQIRTFIPEDGIRIPKQKDTERVVVVHDSLLDLCSAAVFTRPSLSHVACFAPNRHIQDCCVHEGKYPHLTPNLIFSGTVDDVLDFPHLRSDDGGDDAVDLVQDTLDAAFFAITSLLLYSTFGWKLCKADVFVGFCFLAQLRWILKDGKIWHVLATCCQKDGFCTGSMQDAADRMHDCHQVLLLTMLGSPALLHCLRVCCNDLAFRSRFSYQAFSSYLCCLVPILATAMMLLIFMACTVGTAADVTTMLPPQVLPYGTSVQRTGHVPTSAAVHSVLRLIPNEHMPLGNIALWTAVSTSNTASCLGNISQSFGTFAAGYCPTTVTSIFFLMLCAVLVVGPQTCYFGGKGCFCLYALATALFLFEGCLPHPVESGAISTFVVAIGLGLCLSMLFPWACYLVASRRSATKCRGKCLSALSDCWRGVLLLMCAAHIFCSTSSPKGCLPSFLRGSGAGYFAADTLPGQTAFTPNDHYMMHDLLLIGHFVLLPVTTFSGVVVLWNRLIGTRNCIDACIRSIGRMHKLPILSALILDILPNLSALSMFYNLVCSNGCLSPVLQECGASMATFAAESKQLAHAAPALNAWAPPEMPLVCSFVAIFLCFMRATHDGSPWGHKDEASCRKSKPPLFTPRILLLLIALVGTLFLDATGSPSLLNEVSMTYSLVDTNPDHNTFNHLHAVFFAMLLMGSVACTQSMVTCKILSVGSFLALWLLLHSDIYYQAYIAIDWNPDEKALVAACASVALKPTAQMVLRVLQQALSILGITSCWALYRATAKLFQSHTLLPIYSHLGIDTRIHAAPLSIKRQRIRLSHNDGKGQCFWRSVSHRQHAWQNAKQKALSMLLPCSRHAEARHRAQWASQVEIAAYAQASCAPITVLSTQQGKAFTFTPPEIKHPICSYCTSVITSRK